jgi:hypothetical protein
MADKYPLLTDILHNPYATKEYALVTEDEPHRGTLAAVLQSDTDSITFPLSLLTDREQ